MNEHDRQIAEVVWDACVASIRYPSGEPVEIVGNINPYRVEASTDITAHLAWRDTQDGRLSDLENIISTYVYRGPALPGSHSYNTSAQRIHDRAEHRAQQARTGADND